ncbi:MAG: hypothetical protein ACRD36_10040, partial [Candidatus Acidiferrum sp.]
GGHSPSADHFTRRGMPPPAGAFLVHGLNLKAADYNRMSPCVKVISSADSRRETPQRIDGSCNALHDRNGFYVISGQVTAYS